MIQKVIDDIWVKYDKDKNGVLDKNEARRFMTTAIYQTKSCVKVTPATFNVMFAEMDKNGNGTVEKDEMAVTIKKLLGSSLR